MYVFLQAFNEPTIRFPTMRLELVQIDRLEIIQKVLPVTGLGVPGGQNTSTFGMCLRGGSSPLA